MDTLGPKNVVEFAKRFGFDEDFPPYLPIALGAGDVAERCAVGEDNRKIVIVEGMDGNPLQVGQGRRILAQGQVVVSSRQSQRPCRRTKRQQRRGGPHPVPVPFRRGGRAVTDEQVQVRR